MRPGDSLTRFHVRPGDGLSALRHNNFVNALATGNLEKAPGRRGGSAAALPQPFEVYQTGDLEVKVKGGRISWHNQDFDLDDSAAIAIPANTTGFWIWLDLVSEFAPSAPVVASGAAGWTSAPAQPNPPAKRYWLLASVDSGASAISAINLAWHGGDITWPSVFAFWA